MGFWIEIVGSVVPAMIMNIPGLYGLYSYWYIRISGPSKTLKFALFVSLSRLYKSFRADLFCIVLRKQIHD